MAELNAAGSALTFSTYLGGSGNDRAYGLALDSSQNIYITGSTVSTNFPTTTGAFQPALKGASNAFVCQIELRRVLPGSTRRISGAAGSIKETPSP